MPRADDYLEAMNGHKYFALLDLTQGYYQIELARKSKIVSTKPKLQLE